MVLGGLAKLTLLDFPGKVACTVFTLGCNFRCPFCHNASLVEGTPLDSLTVDEFFRFLEKRRGLLDGVAVTGGEPYMQPDILEFLHEIKGRGYAVKTDTNGSYPERLRAAVKEGLVDYVAMDIKNSKEKYATTIGLTATPSAVFESVDFLLSGAVPYEFRTTVVNELHEPGDFAAIGEWIKGAPHYYLQAFTDSGDILSGGMTAATPEKMRACLAAVKPFIANAELRGL